MRLSWGPAITCTLCKRFGFESGQSAAIVTGTGLMRKFVNLGSYVEDCDFADLFLARWRPVQAPVRLALATLLQVVLRKRGVPVEALSHVRLTGGRPRARACRDGDHRSSSAARRSRIKAGWATARSG